MLLQLHDGGAVGTVSSCPLGQEGPSESLPKNWACWHQSGCGRREAGLAGRKLGSTRR